MRLQPGDPFDRYTVEELLGEGGMGEVYRAHDSRLHRGVALKILRKAPDADPESWGKAITRMLREARAAAALSHPNTIAVYDVGEHQGSPFIAMELCEGASLRRFIGAEVPQSTRLRWLLDVARALAAAHRAGVIHRDIKPENVMLRDDGVIKVLDFGIARRVQLVHEGEAASAATSTVTGPGTLVGTPAYMAPEQIRGEDLDGRADQFSWGAMAYELLTGKLPFGHGRDILGVIAGVLGDPPPPLTEVPEVVAATVERALEKRRDDRFASMDEIVELLDPFITGEAGVPSTRSPAVLWEQGRASAPAPMPTPPVNREAATLGAHPVAEIAPMSRRRARPWLLAAAVIALGAGAALSFRWLYAPAPAPPPQASAAPPAPAPAPTPVTELPAPQTRSPEALTAFREGLQAFRDAQWAIAHEAFLRAVKLDPDFAAAYLRLAQTSPYLGSVPEIRAYFQRAISLRAALSERDQWLLEAMEPLLLRNPSDQAEALRRIRAASQRLPGDAELLSLTAAWSTDPAEKLSLARRCTELDPRYADCWQALAMVLTDLERKDEAREALDRCIDAAPAATDCLFTRAMQHEGAGRCELLAEDSRRSIAQTPRVFGLHVGLASALYGLGRSLDTVEAALRHGAEQAPADDRERHWRDAELRLAIIRGDLRRAERIARELGRRSAGQRIAVDVRDAPLVLVELLQELGRERDAARAAEEQLRLREAMPQRLDFNTLWGDATMRLLSAELHGGILDRDRYRAAREAWLRSWEGRVPERHRSAAWLVGYADPALTPEDAREALEVLPRYPQSPVRIVLTEESTIGKVYLLAGRPREALPHLEAAARTCSALRMPIRHTVTHHHLGLAREALGDTAGACASYRVVLDRWPASSGSVTARAAAGRAKALGCPAR